ncbi:MAG: protoporphyrinogen oxidase [bacterium]|nr:protoporphyrinogen oxidase [bacterium]MDT8395113.1 protoporphyrinogen oxidase [bacterium]
MSLQTRRIAVIGGGISGLSAAWFVRRIARQQGRPVQVDLFEKKERPGGKFETVKDQGFTIEGGPNGFLDSKPWTLDLVRELGMEDRLLPSDQAAARRFIYSRGKLHELKPSPVSFFLGGPLSVRGRLRVIGELWARTTPKGKDTSLAEFARRRLGPEALDRLLDPMVSGIFAGDPERMSLRASFPRIAELEEQYGGLTRAMLKIASEKKKAKKRGEDTGAASGPSGPGGVLTSFKSGVSELTDRLALELGEGMHIGDGVNFLRREGGLYRIVTTGGEYEADAVIMATPSDVTAAILSDIAPDSGAILSRIPYSPMAVVGVGFDLTDLKSPPQGFGYLIPGVEKRRILGALWTSSIFPGHRSPAGKFLIRTMVGGAKDHETPFLPDEELIPLVREELRVTMGVEAVPSFTSVIRWRKAIPLYTVGHLDRVAEVEGRLPHGLFLAGNAYRGVGINDCVRESEVAARKALEGLD